MLIVRNLLATKEIEIGKSTGAPIGNNGAICGLSEKFQKFSDLHITFLLCVRLYPVVSGVVGCWPWVLPVEHSFSWNSRLPLVLLPLSVAYRRKVPQTVAYLSKVFS